MSSSLTEKLEWELKKNKGLMSRFFLQKINNGNDETFKKICKNQSISFKYKFRYYLKVFYFK
jgi:hypothetical protein